MSNQYMALYCGDYLGDTMHLSCEEHGAYLLLLMSMWRRGGSVPDDDDDLARIVRLDRQRWQEIKKRLRPLLTFANGEITQKRLQEEVGKARHISEVRKEAANSRHNKINNLASANEDAKGLQRYGMDMVSSDSQKNKKREVPEDWLPSPDQAKRLVVNGFNIKTIDAEIIKFRNYHRAKGSMFVRPAQAFDNWMANAKEFARQRGSPKPNDFMDAVKQHIEEIESRHETDSDQGGGRRAIRGTSGERDLVPVYAASPGLQGDAQASDTGSDWPAQGYCEPDG